MSEFDKDRELVEPVDDKKTSDPAGEPPPKWYTPQQILTGFKDCPEKQQLTILLVVAGLIGLGLGLLRPSMQVAVEQGQVLSGTVSYPTHNSYYIYQVNSWNIWAQLAGLGLFLGLSEAFVSFAFSGLAGIFFFLGSSLWFFIFSKDIRISSLAPLFLMAIHYTLNKDEVGAWEFNYPIMLMGEPHTYGMLGSLLVFLVYALIAKCWYRGAFLLLGIIPGFHLSLGFWLTLTVLIAMLWDWKELISNLKYTLLGYILCIVSFFWQRLNYPIDRLEPSLESYYLDPYMTYWDNHRYGPMLFPQFGIVIIASVVFVGAMCLLIQEFKLSKGEKFLLRSMIVIAVVAIGFTFVSQFPLPYGNKISMLLPSRFLNIISLSYTPIFLGLMWRFRRTPEIEVILPISILAFALPHMQVMPPFWSGIVLIVFSLVLPLALIKQHNFSTLKNAYRT